MPTGTLMPGGELRRRVDHVDGLSGDIGPEFETIETQLGKNVDMNLILDSLYGPIYMRFLIRHDKLTPEFVDGLCELTLGKRFNAKLPHLRSRSS